MAHEPEQTKARETGKTGLGLQTPLPLAECRRLVQAAKPQGTPEQIFTDWAMI